MFRSLCFTQTCWWSIWLLLLMACIHRYRMDPWVWRRNGGISLWEPKLISLRLNLCNDLATSYRNFSKCTYLMPYSSLIYKAQAHHWWIILSWAQSSYYGSLYWTLVLFIRFATCLIISSREMYFIHQFCYPLVIIKIQIKNHRIRDSPLNTCVGEIRLGGFTMWYTCDCK